MLEDQNSIPTLKREIESRLESIDKLISWQLNEILHHPQFKTLEATWRGLHYLVNESSQGQVVKVKILNVRKDELLKDFERALSFEQSNLFQKVYENVYTTSFEEPFGLLIGVYEFNKLPRDISLLEYLSQVAAFAHTPFISAASPELLEVDDFEELTEIRDATRIFTGHSATYNKKWWELRQLPTSRYTGLCLPHILLRDPHSFEQPFNFQESAEKENLLWGNAAFAFGACVARAYNEKSWLGQMSGIDDDGVVEGLYFQYFEDENGVNRQHSLDVLMSRKIASDLLNSGLMPLVGDQENNLTYFPGSSSVYKPKEFDTEAASQNEKSWARLEYIIAGSRFAIYLMCLERDRVGGFMNRQEEEKFLNRWISQYVIETDNASEEAKARQPLREALVNFSEIPGNPGRYKAIVFLRPIYQLEGLIIAMRIVVNLSRPAIVA